MLSAGCWTPCRSLKRRALSLVLLVLVVLVPLLFFFALVDRGALCCLRVSVPNPRVEAAACSPRRSVGFLKTHKCASSSVQNVLLRYGERHNLSFVLPARTNYLGHPRRFQHAMAPGNGTRRFDVLAHHTRFDEAEVRRVLVPDAVLVTIVREPASLFESLYSYYDLRSKSGVSLDAISAGQPSPTLLRRLSRGSKGKLGLNQMSFDLGLDPEWFDNVTVVREFVEDLDGAFDLVMVAERMSESLVLLRNLLCWDVDDVVVFRHNARQNGFRRRLGPRQKDNLRTLNAADAILYDYFVRRLDQRVAAFGSERMARELRLLAQRTRFWYSRCVRDVRPVRQEPKHRFWVSHKVLGFRAKQGSSYECIGLVTPELAFTEHLRQKQQFLDEPVVNGSSTAAGPDSR